MKAKHFILPLLICLYACAIPERPDKNILLNNELIISVPDNWSFSSGGGVDSYVFRIVTNDSVVIKGDWGKYATELNEPSFPVEDIKYKATNKVSPEIINFSKRPEEDMEQGIFRKQYYLYDTIHGIVVKIVQPKRIGHGSTGIYIPRLRDGNSLCIYAVDVDSTLHIKLLQVFKTIRYKYGI